jgi:hypothetical protein
LPPFPPSLSLSLSLTRIRTVTQSDKPLSLPLFSPFGCDRSTAHFDIWPIFKREKRRTRAGE